VSGPVVPQTYQFAGNSAGASCFRFPRRNRPVTAEVLMGEQAAERQ